jgi:histidinol dehydrogenase
MTVNEALPRLKRQGRLPDSAALEEVRRILEEVRQGGDAALDRISQALDGQPVQEISREAWKAAHAALDPKLKEALQIAHQRIEAFYAQEPLGGFWSAGPEGFLGQLVRPLTRVGIYVPGGSAPLLSTLLMSALPARVAGVKELVVVSPPPVHPGVLAAACEVGIDRLFAVGGAQAIAALAFGTDRIPPVEKVVGPGNRYVTLAKREVFGHVGIESLAGPTETMIIADRSARPSWLAADLLAQAEHGADSEAWLLSPEASLLEEVEEELDRQLASLPRASIARRALERGGLVLVENLEQALELANLYAPEHLCLALRDPLRWLGRVQNAGGVFLGEGSPEALGDYLAGPSHVMPTGGTARFGAALGVRDFLKAIPVVGLHLETSRHLAAPAARLAREEGLEAHARALEIRLGLKDPA